MKGQELERLGLGLEGQKLEDLEGRVGHVGGGIQPLPKPPREEEKCVITPNGDGLIYFFYVLVHNPIPNWL
jgi:hypothetical protein